MERDESGPSDPLEGGDTQETRIHELGDGDVEEMAAGDESAQVVAIQPDTTPVRRQCSECGHHVLPIAICDAPRIEDLVLPVYWKTCTVCGPAQLPSWWFCPRERWLAITGSYRVRVTRPR